MKKHTYNTALLALFLTLSTFFLSCSASHQLSCNGEDGVLQKAFDRKNEEEVLASLERGANPNASCTDHPDPPLHRAAELGFLQVVEVLLEAGAQVDSEDSDGYTPLHGAAQGGHTEVATLLLKRGAQIDRKTNYGGETPLHRAAYRGRTAVAALLIKRGAQVDSTSRFGYTPLHSAVGDISRKRSIPLLKLLIDQPQDFHLKTNLGQTALAIAEQRFKEAAQRNDAPGKKFYSLIIAMLKEKMRP